jgi:two-component system phosphate regulon response regulator PhoB
MPPQVVHIIEDEPLHAHLLDRALRQAHFDTTLAIDGDGGWNDVQRLLPSLILLDLMLPGMSGHEVCQLVRRTPSTCHIPIIMLTAVETEDDRIAGLEMGADDYIVKPFSPREVVSRVQAVLRRTQSVTPETDLRAEASLTVQGPCFVVWLHERQLTLTSRELSLLRLMLTQAEQLVSADDLIALLGEGTWKISPEELENTVRSLRRKLENNYAGSIEILPGLRYRFLAHPGPG